MGLLNFFRDIFSRNSKYSIIQEQYSTELTLRLNVLAIQSGINLIASALSKCEFQTVIQNKIYKGTEYYLWNIAPNKHQNKVQFLQKLVSTLIWENEVLIIEHGGELYIADSFNRKEKAFYTDVFENVSIRNLSLKKSFSERDVMYLTYNDENMTALLNSLLKGYQKLISMSMAKYKRAGGRKGVVESGLIPSNSTEWNEALSDLYGDKFKKYFNEENALVVLPSGQKYTEISGEGSKKSTSDVTDIINLTNEVYSQVGRVLRISPSLLKGENADLKSAVDNMLTFAVDPFAELLQTEIISKRYGADAFVNGNYLKIKTNRIKHIDPFSVAVQADKYIADSIYNADEIRTSLGDLPLNTKESQEYVRTKNYESVKGGEKNRSEQ